MKISGSAVSSFIKKDPVLVFSLVLAAMTLPLRKPEPEDFDFDVLILLFDLMIIIGAFSELHVPDYLAVRLIRKCGNTRLLSAVLVMSVWFSSMFLTNDVALMTFVPLTLIVSRKTDIDVLPVVVLQTLAANIGSALMPMGSPHNLFLYLHYGLGFTEMVILLAPFVCVSSVILFALLLKEPAGETKTTQEIPETGSTATIGVYGLLFAVTVLSVAHIVLPAVVFIITVVLTLLLKPGLFRKVNYSLLITFVCFFIFVANVSSLPDVRDSLSVLLDTPEETYIVAVIASQIISNVPASILLSGFTPHAGALINGANVGGMGTVIASMASVITYKLYTAEFPGESVRFLKKFTIYNLIVLIPVSLIIYFTI